MDMKSRFKSRIKSYYEYILSKNKLYAQKHKLTHHIQTSKYIQISVINQNNKRKVAANRKVTKIVIGYTVHGQAEIHQNGSEFTIRV
jgi:hypothetical protein